MDDTNPEEIPDELEQLRAFIIRSHRGIVPEMIAGDSIAELMASIQPACDAYARIADAVKPITVPAGGNTPMILDADSLPTSEKIRRGLAATRKD